MEHTGGPGESGQVLLWYCSWSIRCVQQCRPAHLMQPLASVQSYFSWTNAAVGRTDCSSDALLLVAELVGRIYLGAGIDAIWVVTGACSATSRAAPLTTVHSIFGAVGIRDAALLWEWQRSRLWARGVYLQCVFLERKVRHTYTSVVKLHWNRKCFSFWVKCLV